MDRDENMLVSKTRASLEELWLALDTFFEALTLADWQRPHGQDWVFADLPYHLAYMDRLCVARPIEQGEALPAAERVGLRSLNQLNAWNQGQFDARPAGQTVEETLAQMHGSRDGVRRILAGLSDTDLDRPAWFPLLNMRGFRPAKVGLAFCTGHTWQHLEEARIRYGRAGTLVGPELTHEMLNGTVPGIPLYLIVSTTGLFLDAFKARELDFSFGLHITDPGGGMWAFQAGEEGWQVAEVEAANTDLILSMGLDPYIKLRYFISDLGTLVEEGKIKASDEKALEVYRQLFALPDFDFEFPKMP